MPTKFTAQQKKDWIEGYESAYRSISKTIDVLYFLSEILKNDAGNELVLSCAALDGLNHIITSIGTELDKAQVGELLLPAQFADLVGGGNE